MRTEMIAHERHDFQEPASFGKWDTHSEPILHDLLIYPSLKLHVVIRQGVSLENADVVRIGKNDVVPTVSHDVRQGTASNDFLATRGGSHDSRLTIPGPWMVFGGQNDLGRQLKN